jgi:hypothetical protein
MSVISATVGESHRKAGVDDPEYDAFLVRIQARFDALVGEGRPVFTTSAANLWDEYIGGMMEEYRQHHTCHACRTFFERYAGLVVISETGEKTPILSKSDAIAPYGTSFHEVERFVNRATVTGVFLSSDKVWGLPVTGEWHHYAIKPPKAMVYPATKLLSASQAMAEKKEDFANVSRAIHEFSLPMIETALTILNADALYRSEKVIGQAKWLHNLHVAYKLAKVQNKRNVVWLAVATAPAGFCHPRSSMIGTLLEDIAAGMEFDQVKARFDAKMHPLQYQRPQAAPAAGTIAQAEKVIERLKAAGSLARRYARVDELQALWRPAAETPVEDQKGIFGHLKAKGAVPAAKALCLPSRDMTWVKFEREILPTATKIEFYVLSTPDNYTAFVTAANMDAPPIIQWDSEEQRNPVSWYVYHGGSAPTSFGLVGGTWHEVAAVTLSPSGWFDSKANHYGESVVFVLDGAHDTRSAGLALFPEILKSEFHGIRSVIEAYSRSGTIEGKTEPMAAGIRLQKGDDWNARFRVTVAGAQSAEYRLDRWD